MVLFGTVLLGHLHLLLQYWEPSVIENKLEPNLASAFRLTVLTAIVISRQIN